MFGVTTILHATDFSEAAQQAFHVAVQLALVNQARLVLLHVQADDADDLNAIADRLRELKAQHPRLPVEIRVETGTPARAIVRTARELQADMIVLGSRGRSGLERLLLGSVAEQVLRRAECPVLTVSNPPRPALAPVLPLRAASLSPS
jgi:nucleotide-binding universal stress UspA family protein